MANLSEAFDQDLEPDRDVRMVLRIVSLPPDIDDKLRVRAFHLNQTKDDLIREAVTRWLDEAGTSTAKAKVANSAKPSGRAARRARSPAKTV